MTYQFVEELLNESYMASSLDFGTEADMYRGTTWLSLASPKYEPFAFSKDFFFIIFASGIGLVIFQSTEHRFVYLAQSFQRMFNYFASERYCK